MGLKLISQYGNYPNTYREFVKMFPDDAACEAFLFKVIVGICVDINLIDYISR